MRLQSFYWQSVLGVVLPLFLIFLAHEQGDIVLIINGWHHPVLDVFFTYFTRLGNGIIFLFFTLVLVAVKFRHAIITALVGGVHALFIGITKNGLFPHQPRPKNFFDADIGLNFIQGVDVHGWMSFPSGHTASAFALALLISLITKNRTVTALFLVYALLVAFSRIYLLQHFYKDVFSGAVIGLLSTFLVWKGLAYNALPGWVDQKLVLKVSLQLQPGPKNLPRST